MNLQLYAESRTTIDQLRAAARDASHRGPAPHPLAYPDEVYLDAGLVSHNVPSAFQQSIDALFEWPAHEQAELVLTP